ncbi:MAG: hypothetical protein LBV69_10285 [Bacteroidales bacterium]|jgi:hypothetical protein|nr:hypothetical protein [Bacteroidales bacterium]
MTKKKLILTEKELEIFSNELLDDFQQMELFGGLTAANTGCSNDKCKPIDAACGDANVGCKSNCSCPVSTGSSTGTRLLLC